MVSSREIRNEQADDLARLAFLISTVVMFAWMGALQYLLFKMHQVRDRASSPSLVETTILITISWVSHKVLDTLLNIAMDTAVPLFSSQWTADTYQRIRENEYSLVSWSGCMERGQLRMLYQAVAATWVLHHLVVLARDTLVPFLLSPSESPLTLIQGVQTRAITLTAFFSAIISPPAPAAPRRRSLVSFSNAPTDLIGLTRRQDARDRTLSWDLTIEQHALNEMMETLGPPGGFGELGFNVAGDRVCFGAMGVGTSFNLTFLVDRDGKKKRVKEKRPGLAEGNGRRKSWMN